MPKGHPLARPRRSGLGAASPGAERARDRLVSWLGQNTVSRYLRALGGIRPRRRRRAERCLTPRRARGDLARRSPAVSRHARSPAALGRSHTTIAREIGRCGGRRRYRAHAAERETWRRARRPRPTKLELCGELRRLVVQERLRDDNSPEQIAGWLRIEYPDNEAMQVSHETIYRSLYVQARGTLKRELTQHLRTGPLEAICPLAVVKAPGPGQDHRDGDDLRAPAGGRRPRGPRPLGGRPADGKPPNATRSRRWSSARPVTASSSPCPRERTPSASARRLPRASPPCPPSFAAR